MGALEWVGAIVEWFCKFIPRILHIKATEEGVYTQEHLLRKWDRVFIYTYHYGLIITLFLSKEIH